jgi:hypothetical protein
MMPAMLTSASPEDRGRVGDVEDDRLDPGVRRRDLVEQVLATAGDDDAVSRGVESNGQTEAEARGRAGDEDGVVRGFHGSTLAGPTGVGKGAFSRGPGVPLAFRDTLANVGGPS